MPKVAYAQDGMAAAESLLAGAEKINQPRTGRETATVQRVGQAKWRRELLDLWCEGCAVTGIDRPDFLRASHIEPWRDSGPQERLDRFNGLVLTPTLDHLFDRGWLTFEENGRVVPASAVTAEERRLLGLDAASGLRWVHHQHAPYLAYHRAHIYRG